MSKGTLADFFLYTQKAKSFQAFYSGPDGDFFTGSGLLDCPEQIKIYTGVDDKQYLNLDVGTDHRFFMNLALDKDVEIKIIDALERPDPMCRVIFEKGGCSLTFYFWM